MSATVQIEPESVRVDFLIDSGSNRTLLSEEDARFAGIPLGSAHSDDTMWGFGGATSVAWYPVSLLFPTAAGRVFAYRLDIGVLSSSSGLFFPSILGRDILNQWRLTLDGRALTVQSEVLACDFHFDH